MASIPSNTSGSVPGSRSDCMGGSGGVFAGSVLEAGNGEKNVTVNNNDANATNIAMNRQQQHPTESKSNILKGSTTTTTEHDENDESDESDDSDNGGTGTFWDLFFSLYVPFALIALKKTMFGSLNLIRSLIVGHAVRILLGYRTEWIESGSIPSWLQHLVNQCADILSTLSDAASPSSSSFIGPQSPASSQASSVSFPKINSDPQAWPQQFLTALGVLTIFALVIHPDGFTWVVLGRIRDSIVSVFNAIADCWEVLGIFPTLAALMTFAALCFLMFLVMKTLSSKTPKRPIPTRGGNKKKKRKSGDNKSRGARRGEKQRHPNSDTPSRIKRNRGQQEDEEPTMNGESIEASKNDGSHARGGLSPLPEEVSTTALQLGPEPVSESGIVKTGEKEDAVANDQRSRVFSSATQDTIPLSDDISCSSTSVRSFPSVSVSSSRSKEKERESSSTSANTPSRKGGKRSNGRSSEEENARQGKKKGTQIEQSIPSSRWDALKPDMNINMTAGNRTFDHGQKSPYHTHSHDKQHRYGHRNNHRKTANATNRKNGYGKSTSPADYQVSGSLGAMEDKQDTGLEGSPVDHNNVHNPQGKSIQESQRHVGKYSPSDEVLPPPPPGFQQHHVSNVHVSPLILSKSEGAHRDDDILPLLQPNVPSHQVSPAESSVFGSASYPAETHFAREAEWNEAATLFPSPSSASPGPQHLSPERFATKPKENPFDDTERRMEDELKELEALGGQMAGSILDF